MAQQFRKYSNLGNLGLNKLIFVARFPKEAKITSVEKTNDPGPATYAYMTTVGNIPKYQRNEANARVVPLPPRKNDD